MTVSVAASPGLASRLINGILAIRPLANLLKQQARTLMIKRAESIGVQWTQDAQALRDRGLGIWNSERQQIQDPHLIYPNYYLKPFHAYETGNLSWDAATEAEVAAYAVHAQIWSKDGSKHGDAQLRNSYQTLLKQHIAHNPLKILDLGCSVGMSTAALQETYPNADVTGLDLSPYFLTVAQYQHRRAQCPIQWVHAAAEKTPFDPGSFDLISTFLMCHELPQSATRAVLQEARRLLRPGGHFALMDMNPSAEAFAKLPPYVFTLLKSTEPYLDEYFTLDLEDAVVSAGFTVPQVFCNSPRHRTLIAQAC